MTAATRFAVAAAACALVLAAPAPASAALSCNHSAGTLTVTLSAGGDFVLVTRSGNDIAVMDSFSTPVACTGTPTVTNTNLIQVNDVSGSFTTVRISTDGGAFAPGATDENGLSDEIEIQVDMGVHTDELILVGSSFGDSWRLGKTAAGEGANLNVGSESGVTPGRDVDLEYTGVESVRLLDTGGGDRLLASGGPEFLGALTTPIRYKDVFGGDDTVEGGDGADTFDPGPGKDQVSGGLGDDVFEDTFSGTDDDLDGGPGVDRLLADGFSESMRVDLRLTGRQDMGVLGRDVLSGIENVTAGTGDDVLIGDDGSNELVGNFGDDLVAGLGGALDTLDGTIQGSDTVSYATPSAGATEGVTVDLGAGAVAQDTGGAGIDIVAGFANVVGSPFADTLAGDESVNRFEVRDGVRDSVTCGIASDTVIADVQGVDSIAADCETREFDFRPDTKITSGPPSLGSDATPTFAFTSTKPGSTFQCSLDGATFSACSSPHTLAKVSDGAHSFAVRARDMLGALDLSPSTRSFSVDTSAAAFGRKTLVTLASVGKRIPAGGALAVKLSNKNTFAVTGRLSGRTAARVEVARKRVVRLKSKAFKVPARATRTVKLALPKPLRRLLARKGKLSLRLAAKVSDPAGHTRTVRKRVVLRVKGKR